MNELEGFVSNIEKISNDSKLNVKTNTTKINEIKSIIPKNSDYSNIVDVSDSDNLLFINHQQTRFIRIIKLDDHSGLSSKEFEDLCFECPRFTKSFLKDYESNGTKCIADTLLSNVVEKLYTFAKKINPFLNHCLINWFESTCYIGKQSENTKLLIKDSDIFSFSFGPAVRRFILQPKIESDNNKIYRVEMHNNLNIIIKIMSGRCQMKHYHSVERSYDDDEINDSELEKKENFRSVINELENRFLNISNSQEVTQDMLKTERSPPININNNSDRNKPELNDELMDFSDDNNIEVDKDEVEKLD
ncbi:unnamed protein product [Brachionus calyciflorus]|uniref:Uncharacterized protein n=1 Tax=Brachionus calyciflorus TaxID=104777 RepID=A0A813QM08_9BILA|nr:unnamed protein product [Brachionus calyciflorus]